MTDVEDRENRAADRNRRILGAGRIRMAFNARLIQFRLACRGRRGPSAHARQCGRGGAAHGTALRSRRVRLLGFVVPKSLAKAMLKQQEELRPLVPLRRQQNVDGLAGMIHRTMAIVALPFHLGVGILLANA